MRARFSSRPLLLALAAAALLPAGVAHAIPGWTQIKPTLLGPNAALWEPGVWNPAGDCLLYPQDGTLWSLSGTTGLWSSKPISGPIPGLHTGTSAVLDAARNRILVFGGTRGGPIVQVNEIWELTLGASPTWRKLSPGGTPPAGRWFTSLVLDPPGQRLILFGGAGTQQYNDVWSLSLAPGDGAWQSLIAQGTPGSPSARERQGTVFDPVRRRMLVFGGVGSVLTNDLWALSLGTPTPAWQSIATSHPPAPRDEMVAVYDAGNDRLVIQGGTNDVQEFADAFALPLTGPAVWKSLPADPVGSQEAAPFGYDASRQRILLMIRSTTRALDLAGPQWSVFETHPSPRGMPSGAVASDTRRLFITGGNGPNGYLTEAWSLDLASPSSQWQDAAGSPSGVPEERSEVAITWDPLRARFLTFGGQFGNDLSNEVWSVTMPSTWTQLDPTNFGPLGGLGWRVIYDPSGDRAIVFEWRQVNHCCPPTPASYENHLFELPLSGSSALEWTEHPILPAGWRGRHGASFSYDSIRDCAWLFGGEDSTVSASLGELWKIDLTGVPALVPVSTTGTPPISRQLHAAVFDAAHDQLVIFGGQHDLGPSQPRPFLNDTWVLQTGTGNRWLDLTNEVGHPPARVGAVSGLLASTDEMVVYGGQNSDLLGDIWSLPLAATVGVDPGAPSRGLLLAAADANPVRGDLRVAITLPEAGAGSVDLLDVTGRVLHSESLRGMNAGTHVVTLASRAEVPPGIYFARLRQSGGERRLRLALLR